MITSNISTILLITGLVTMLPLLQFLFPAAFLKLLNKIEIKDEAGLFFARHWGMMAFIVGGLLVYAAGHGSAFAHRLRRADREGGAGGVDCNQLEQTVRQGLCRDLAV